MTIDEAYNTCFGKPYIVPIDKHEEARNIIRDLIEEVKQYRKIGTVEECKNSVLDIERTYNKGYADGSLSVTSEIRNKVIDDFAKAILSNPVVDKSVVRRVAEQFKEGD